MEPFRFRDLDQLARMEDPTWEVLSTFAYAVRLPQAGARQRRGWGQRPHAVKRSERKQRPGCPAGRLADPTPAADRQRITRGFNLAEGTDGGERRLGKQPAARTRGSAAGARAADSLIHADNYGKPRQHWAAGRFRRRKWRPYGSTRSRP